MSSKDESRHEWTVTNGGKRKFVRVALRNMDGGKGAKLAFCVQEVQYLMEHGDGRSTEIGLTNGARFVIALDMESTAKSFRNESSRVTWWDMYGDENGDTG